MLAFCGLFHLSSSGILWQQLKQEQDMDNDHLRATEHRARSDAKTLDLTYMWFLMNDTNMNALLIHMINPVNSEF